MPKAYCLSLLLTIGAAFFVNAQNSTTDSLIQLSGKAPEDTNKVNLYRQIGVTIIYQDAAKAIPWFKKGISLAKKLQFEPGLERCYAAASLAYSFNAVYDTSLAYIDTAVYYAKKVGVIKRLALVYLNRGDVEVNLQNFSSALKDLDTAIKFTEQIHNKDGLGRIYLIMAGVYTDQQQYAMALTSMDKSQAYFEQVKNVQMIAMIYSDRADLFIRTNEPAKAIPLYKKAIYMADSLEDIENLSAYHGGLAEAYFHLKNYAEADTMSRIALSYAKQTGNRRQEAVIYTNFLHINLQQNNYAKAVEYGLKGYTILKEEKDLLREQGITSALSEAYFKMGNTGQAYNYLKISHELNDSLLRRQFSDETAKLQTTFQVSEKNKEIQLLNKDKELQYQKFKEQRYLLTGAVLLFILVLVGVGLLINRYRLRQRMKELELRNRIAADLHDEVGSSLSSIHMLSQMVTQQGNDTSQQAILSRMSTNAKETMDKMGDIVWMIKPGETETGNLRQRMERFAYDICSSRNVDASLSLEELERAKLTMDQRKNIYLIFKEAVNNAVKYSGTDKIEIMVNVQGKELVLHVKDFGKGFDSSIIKKGNGLDNMLHRAKEMRGSLALNSVPGKGTDIQLRVPV
jgi:two-component system, NarL family, sensor histidine kinase UhpB